MGAPQLQYAIPAGGGVPVGVAGAGTVNRLTKWTAATTIGDSGVSDDGATVSFVARNLSSSSAQTWTLASSATALNIQSGLLNLDTANSRVGIGVTDPGVLLEVYGNGAAYPGIIRASGNGVGGTSAFQAAKFSTDADGSIFQFIKHRGTRAAPTTVATGDILGSSQYVAYGGTSFRTLSQIVAGVTAYTSDSNISSYLSFATSTAGSAAGTEKMRIDATGNVGIGTASPAALLHVNGNQIGGAGASVTPYAQALFGPSSSYTMWWKTNATAGGGIIGTAGPGMQFYVVSGSPNAPTALQVANFDSTGNFILGAATGVSIQAAGTNQGLKLATTPGNTDPNTLDCYKEDTWTPTLSAAASWGGTQPTVSVARYVRIGSTVHCTVVLVGAPNFSSTYLATTITAPFSATYNAAVPISSGATAFGCAQHNAGGTTLFLPTFGVVGAATFSWTFIV